MKDEEKFIVGIVAALGIGTALAWMFSKDFRCYVFNGLGIKAADCIITAPSATAYIFLPSIGGYGHHHFHPPPFPPPPHP